MAYSFNPFTGNLDKVSVEDLSLLKLQDLSDVDKTDKATSKILQVRADGKHEYVTLPNPDLTPYWKSDGSSTATGDWDLGANDLSATNGAFTGNVGIGTSSFSEKLVISGAGTQRFLINDTGGTASLKFAAAGDDAFFGNASATGDIFLQTNNINRIQLSNAGGFSLGASYINTDAGLNNMLVQGKLSVGLNTQDKGLNVAGGSLLTGGIVVGSNTLTSNLIEMRTAGGHGTNTKYYRNGSFRFQESWTSTDLYQMQDASGNVLFQLAPYTAQFTMNGGLSVTGESLFTDKLKFTQTDGNEYIDSLNDGYLDIGATTGIRLLKDTTITGTASATTLTDGTATLTGGVLTGATTINGIDIETAFYLPTPDREGLISDGTAFVTDDTAGASDIEIPVKDVISITRSGTTCTVTSTAHGFPTDASVTIAGASSGYNGEFTITSTGDDTFTYEVTGTPASPATGTITATNYWVQLTSRSTNKGWAFNFTLSTNAAGSNETHILQVTGSAYSSAAKIKYRGVNGYYWISHFRTSVQNNNLKLEAKLHDTTRSYSLSWVAEMVSGEMGTDNGGIEANSFPITGAGRINTSVVNELDATSLNLTHPGAWIFGDNDLLEFKSFGTYSNGAGLMQKWSDTYYDDTWGRFGMERAATTKDFVWKDMYNTTETTVEAMRLTGDGILKVNDIQTTGSVKGVHKAADGTSAVADGTYTMGLGTTTNGTITIKDGLITSVTEAVD